MLKKEDREWLNLSIQAMISLKWLEECQTCKDDNLSYRLKQYMEQNQNVPLINPGILMCYSYIAFVYPRESCLKSVNTNKLNFSNFKIKRPLQEIKSENIIRRLRNSISHANFHITPDANIIFKDDNKSHNDPFEAEISCGDFGHFVQSFFAQLKKQAFKD
jgi:hypothetical protein